MLKLLASHRAAVWALTRRAAEPASRRAIVPKSLGWAHQRGYANAEKPNATEEGSSTWMPSWLRNRLPASLGGDREATALETMDLDAYATALKRARQMGSLSGFVSGTSRISDPLAQGNLRVYENIIGAMLPEEKSDLSIFSPASRQRVASQVGCTLAQVDDCIAKFEWMKQMTGRMAALKRQGKPLPKSVDEMERTIGNWRGYKQQEQPQSVQPPGSSAAGAIVAASNLVDPKGRPCPLAGRVVGRNSKCPATRKSWKNCCGKAHSGRKMMPQI